MGEPILFSERVSLKSLLEKEQIVAPCMYDCISTRVIEKAGFKAALLSSMLLSHSMLGMPDLGLITSDEFVAATERITNTTRLPIIVDGDEGYGDSPLNVFRFCQRTAKAGAMAITIDDSTAIRGVERAYYGSRDSDSNYYDNFSDTKLGIDVCSMEMFVAKIKAAVKAVEGTDCIIIARTMARRINGFEDALERMVQADKAGAHMTMILNIGSLEECRKMNEKLPGWKMFPDWYTVDGKPVVSLEELAELGFNLVTCHFLEKGAMWGMLEYAKHVYEDKSTLYPEQHNMNGYWGDTFDDADELGSWRKWLALEDELNQI